MTSNEARRAERWVYGTCIACALPSVLALLTFSPTRVAACVAFAFLPYAVMLTQANALTPARGLRLALFTAAISGLALVCAPPVLSDDLYRYLWDGRVTGAGLDPYAHAPDSAALYDLRDALYEHINHRELRTIYPPFAQLVFALVDKLSHTETALKLTMLLVHLSTLYAVARLTEGRSARAVLAYALNPLALSESALNGHIDVMAGAALAWGVWGLSQRRGLFSALALMVATGSKLIGILLLPLSARLGVRSFARACVLSGIVLVPMLVPRAPDTSGAIHYAQRWQGNDALFSVMSDGVSTLLSWSATEDERKRGHLTLPSMRPWLVRVKGTMFDPWAQADAARREVPDRADFEIQFLAGLITRGLVLTIALFLSVWLATTRLSALSAARLSVLAALLLAPQIHPWYLLWLLPLEAAAGGLGGLTWSVSVLVAYAPLDLWQRARIWNEASLAKLCEFGIVGLVFLVEAWLFNRERPETHVGLSSLPDRPRGP